MQNYLHWISEREMSIIHCHLFSSLFGVKAWFKHLLKHRIASVFNLTSFTEKDCSWVAETGSPNRFCFFSPGETSPLSEGKVSYVRFFPEHFVSMFSSEKPEALWKAKPSASRSGEVACLWNLTMMCPWHLLAYRRPFRKHQANRLTMQ